MKTIILLATIKTPEVSTSLDYEIGAVIALFVFVYLLYSLIKPEKF